ncbi:MAG: HAD family phosphatase [Erysipelotrichaceae bacterium]|nr:HAD family phosphatase [Erysipelotrichaceae bacterium]
MSKKLKAVLFDLDGVLFDTEYISAETVCSRAEAVGIHLDFNEVLLTAGIAHDKARVMFDEMLKDIGGFEEFRKRTAHFPKHEMPFKDIKIPYVDELLQAVKAAGLKTAVCSSSTPDYIRKALSEGKIEKYIDYQISGYQLPVGKPDPAIYLKAAAELDIKPEEAVVVEDSSYGIESGKRAGCFVIAYHDPKFNYDQSKADMSVDDYRDLIEFIKHQ